MAFLGLDDILVLEKDKGTVQRIVKGPDTSRAFAGCQCSEYRGRRYVRN